MTLATELIYPSLSNITAPPSCVTHYVKSGKTGITRGARFKAWSADEGAAMKRNYEERPKAAFQVLRMASDSN